MLRPRDILLLDAGAARMQELASRIRQLGYRVLPAKTPQQARTLLGIGSARIGALLLPPQIPALDLRAALATLREVACEGLSIVGVGERPDADERRRLRTAGVELALWGHVDDHTLRFQINRALAGSTAPKRPREAVRAPVTWSVAVWAGRRRKACLAYTVSARGAFLSVPNPSPRGSPVRVHLPLPSGQAELAGRIAMTNVPGNLERANLPIGMGVSFERTPAGTELELLRVAEERLRALDV